MNALVVWDDDLVEHELDGVSVADVLERVRELNGQTRTLVTVFIGDAHLAAGGSSSDCIVLYVSFDGSSFYQVTRATGDRESIQVVAGGQAAAYESRFVVDLAIAERAVQEFMNHGSLASDLDWERS